MAWASFIFVSLVWSANFLMMKKATLAFGPLGIASGRLLGGAATLALFWWWRRDAWPFRREQARGVLFVALIIYVWPFTLIPHLISRHGSAFAGMIIGLVPLATLLAGIPMLGHRPGRRQTLGVLGGLGFLGLLLSDSLQRAVPTLDLLAAFTIPVCYAIGNTYIRVRFGRFPALPLACLSLLVAGVLLLPPAVGLETVRRNEHLPLAVLNLTLVGILATGITMHQFYGLIQQRGPLFAGMTAYLIPAGALLWGWLDGETVTGKQLIGLLGILAMVAVAQFPSPRDAPPAPAPKP